MENKGVFANQLKNYCTQKVVRFWGDAMFSFFKLSSWAYTFIIDFITGTSIYELLSMKEPTYTSHRLVCEQQNSL